MTKYEHELYLSAKHLLIDIDGSLYKFKCPKKFRSIRFEDILDLRKVLYAFKLEEFKKAKKLALNLDSHICELLPKCILEYVDYLK